MSHIVPPCEVNPELQVEVDGLRLGVCLAIAQRLERYPNFMMPELRASLTEGQKSAVDRYKAKQAVE